MELAPLRRGHRRVLVTARAAAALVLALFAALPAAPQAGDAVEAEPVLRWRLDTTTPFVWQAVTAVLELVAPAPLPLTGPPRVEPVAGLDLQPLPAGDGIEALDGTDRFVIPVARYRLTARIAGRTTLAIAHRLSTVRGMDRILVFHKGELREAGPHRELLARRGLYHTLYQLQYRGQEPAAAEGRVEPAPQAG